MRLPGCFEKKDVDTQDSHRFRLALLTEQIHYRSDNHADDGGDHDKGYERYSAHQKTEEKIPTEHDIEKEDESGEYDSYDEVIAPLAPEWGHDGILA